MIVTLIFFAVFVLIILGFNYAIKVGKKRIEAMLTGYSLCNEYQGKKLDELYEMFEEKFKIIT